jgi:hypothetical protein
LSIHRRADFGLSGVRIEGRVFGLGVLMLAILADSRRETETPTSTGARRRDAQRPPCELTLRGLELLSILNEVFDGSPSTKCVDDDSDCE